MTLGSTNTRFHKPSSLEGGVRKVKGKNLTMMPPKPMKPKATKNKPANKRNRRM